ncbi:endolytic transglycosylase MltG [Halobacillus sp. Marseille-Q1614]|uniref:endolytic transglycosylase MltG n=1 Tax=Halobacillus sp. Marseille-Q1614 TaxID=2709134 RepID=UPI001570CEF4|nr:endolytic transglycosylase MltG [Halobacillus sp. Marseille-Q1614]
MKKPLQFFSIGLLTATALISVFFITSPDSSSKTVTALSDEKMIDQLQSKNYHVLTEEQAAELESMAAKAEEIVKEEKAQDHVKEEEKEDKEQVDEKPSTYTLVVNAGTSSTEISQILEDKGFIDSAESFNIYLDDRNLTEYVQIGEFEIVEEMNRDEIADKITRQ